MITLHCTTLHCIALHRIALHCTALHRIALHCTALPCIELYCLVTFNDTEIYFMGNQLHRKEITLIGPEGVMFFFTTVNMLTFEGKAISRLRLKSCFVRLEKLKFCSRCQHRHPRWTKCRLLNGNRCRR